MTDVKRVKITHDGSKYVWDGSRIYDADTGEHLSGVKRIEVILDVGEPPRAIVYLDRAELDITTEAELTQYERGMVARIAEAVEMRLRERLDRHLRAMTRAIALNIPFPVPETPDDPSPNPVYPGLPIEWRSEPTRGASMTIVCPGCGMDVLYTHGVTKWCACGYEWPPVGV